MLVLDATTKSITVAMSGAATTTNPDFVTTYSDNNGTTFTEGSSDGVLNGTTQVTLVAAPAAATRRIIKSIRIENKDTVAVTLTITYNNNSTLRTLYKVVLQVGDTWTLEGTRDTNGNIKTIAGSVNLATGVVGTLPPASGGTGQTTYTDGQLLIGNTLTTGVSKATLTAGSGVTITNGNGSITIASTGATTGKAIAMSLIFGF